MHIEWNGYWESQNTLILINRLSMMYSMKCNDIKVSTDWINGNSNSCIWWDSILFNCRTSNSGPIETLIWTKTCNCISYSWWDFKSLHIGKYIWTIDIVKWIQLKVKHDNDIQYEKRAAHFHWSHWNSEMNIQLVVKNSNKIKYWTGTDDCYIEYK